MEKSNLKLYIEINNVDLIFIVFEKNSQNNFKIIYDSNVLIKGVEKKSITNMEEFFNLIKENIFLIEKKFNHTFKEVILILENLNTSFINLTGYKRLNGTQISRENITYILNSLKSYVSEIEKKKKILHIFNTNFNLDNKKVENLPIGLFGDFYSHELSFAIIKLNDYKNLEEIFSKCNLKIKKVLLKSFIKGVCINKKNDDINTFFQIKLNNDNSKVFYFENNALKFEEDFEFGLDIILRDVSKITYLKMDIVKQILEKTNFTKDSKEDELIEKDFFQDENYRKIKKKLIYEIISERIKEILNLILFKNINFQHLNKSSKAVFLEFNIEFKNHNIKAIFTEIFKSYDKFNLEVTNELTRENIIKTADKIVHFGWKKEAIPITQIKKSLIGRLFEGIFG